MRNFIIISILAALAVIVFFTFRNNPQIDAAVKMSAKKDFVETITLKKALLGKTIHLPGDLLPYEAVDIYSKVSGFIGTINADRGTEAKKGDLLVQLIAPELNYRFERARALYCAADDLYKRNLQIKVPNISPLELEASKDAADAAFNRMNDLQEQINYLAIHAPFDGVITTRYLHSGAFVIAGGNTGALPIFRIETIVRLRLVVPVPEADIESIRKGMDVPFTVSAYPQRQFIGKVARISHSLDQRTRTEPVELDVDNSNRLLAPGMYADIIWPVNRSRAGFIVPSRAVVTTTKKVFVIRIKDKTAEWVDVTRGDDKDNSVEIFGDLKEGDVIVADATDEIRPGEKITVK